MVNVMTLSKAVMNVLVYVNNYPRNTFAELGFEMGISGVAVRKHCLTLKAAGYVDWTRKSRSLVITKAGHAALRKK